MGLRRCRLTFVAVMVAVLAAPATTAVASPPAVDQYTTHLPGAGGNSGLASSERSGRPARAASGPDSGRPDGPRRPASDPDRDRPRTGCARGDTTAPAGHLRRGAARCRRRSRTPSATGPEPGADRQRSRDRRRVAAAARVHPIAADRRSDAVTGARKAARRRRPPDCCRWQPRLLRGRRGVHRRQPGQPARPARSPEDRLHRGAERTASSSAGRRRADQGARSSGVATDRVVGGSASRGIRARADALGQPAWVASKPRADPADRHRQDAAAWRKLRRGRGEPLRAGRHLLGRPVPPAVRIATPSRCRSRLADLDRAQRQGVLQAPSLRRAVTRPCSGSPTTRSSAQTRRPGWCSPDWSG